MESVLDLWDFSERNQLGLTRQESLIAPTESLVAGVDRVLATAVRFLLEHCESVVSREVWPERSAELIQLPSTDEIVRKAGLLENLNIVDYRG